MRMDNETFRLKVENLFGSLRSAEGDGVDRMVMAELEQLAATPRKSRYFLKAVAAQDDPALQEHFYRSSFAGPHRPGGQRPGAAYPPYVLYRSRAGQGDPRTCGHTRGVARLFRVIALTEEGWLAGELIRIVFVGSARGAAGAVGGGA